jgi:hypothetical protein
MRKLKHLALLTILISVNSYAFLIECNDPTNKDVAFRFLKQNDEQPLVGEIAVSMSGAVWRYHLKMDDAYIASEHGRENIIRWSGENLYFLLIMSQEPTPDSSNVTGLMTYKSQILFVASNYVAVDRRDMACRWFRM